MKPKVYIETSIISYLTARPSKNVLAAAWQQSTADWWTIQRPRFDLFTSELVVEEAEQGDAEAASKRLVALCGKETCYPQRMCGKRVSVPGDLHTHGADGRGLLMKDEIIEQIWRAKDMIGKKYNYDVRKLAENLRKHERASGAVIVNLRQGLSAKPDGCVAEEPGEYKTKAD
jgi:hypothetical protein